MSSFSVQFPGQLLRDPEVSSAAKIVYAELLANAEKRDVVRIGQRLIAERIGMSPDSVTRALAELVKQKYIARIKADPGKRDSYKILPLEPPVEKPSPKLRIIRSLPRHVDPEEMKPYFCNREVVQRWVERNTA